MTAITEAESADTTADDAIPGGGDMWAFVMFETLVFVSYFCVYLYFRTQDEAGFLEAQSELNLPLGIVDTCVLLTSSWSIAACVQKAREGAFHVARRLAVVTVVLGALFTTLKLAEWVHLVGDGHTFTENDFMQHFFFLTGLHAIHLFIGFVVLGLLIRQLSVPRLQSLPTIETCATYWHTVDLFWILIFAMLYVVR
jgi:nitric oxide reductase NorE protein